MIQGWFITLLLVCLVAIAVYAFVARKKHGSTKADLEKPEAIRRGKHINE